MIVNYVSDIHLESGKLFWNVPDEADVLVIAGDLWNGNSGLYWLEEIAQEVRQPIVYVPGNHCFWDNDLHKWPALAKKFCDEIGVYFLYNNKVEIKGTWFLGTTLWTDYDALGNRKFKMAAADPLMSDFKWIKGNGPNGEVTAEEIYQEHRTARRWLDSELALHKDDTTCVVTHHAPSKRSIPQGFEDNKYIPYYVSDLDDFVKAHKPDVWIHGHIHQTQHYFIDDTLVLNNARGHDDKPPPYKNPNFSPELVVEF